jgi:hypothetical protein
VEPSEFALVAAEVREDSLTFQFRGRKHPGDSAWVVRFSQKSTEQDPVALSDVHSLLPVLAEGRRNFAVLDEGEKEVAESTAAYVRYRFDSAVHDEKGQPLAGRGIVVVLRRSGDSGTVVYHIKLDNHGDRDDLSWDDLEPFLRPLAGG